MFALAAVVTVGAASFVSSSAEARGFGGGGFHGGGMRVGGMGHVGGFNRVGIGRVGFGRVGFNRVGFNRVGFNHFRPGFRRWGFNHHRWWWHHRRPILVGGGVYLGTSALAATYAAPQAAAQPAPTCTCLTKQYTPEGLVVFQDVCTKEVASAPTGNTQAQLPMPPQPDQPQQQ
jgi:hypothetical protein